MEAQAFELDNPFARSRACLERMVDRLQGDEMLGATHSELEEVLESEGREVMRQLMQDHLDLRASRERPPLQLVGSDGEVRTHRRVRSRSLLSVFGALTVTRTMLGGRGLEALAPLDAELNLPNGLYSHGLRRRVVEEIIGASFDDTVTAVERTTGVKVPKRQAEEVVRSAAADFDVFYAAGGGAGVASTGDEQVLVLTCDGKGVVMTPAGLREATRKAAEAGRHKLGKRLSKGEKRNRKRMATVASVYAIEPHVRTPEDVVAELRPVRDVAAKPRPRPVAKRVWASLVHSMGSVIDEMFEEALRRDPNKEMRWVAVVDGNKSQIRLLRERAAALGVQLTIVLDVIHVIEYLWKAANALYGEGKSETERAVTERLVKVLGGKARAVAAGLKQSATKRKLHSANRKRVHSAANYLLNNAPLLAYDNALVAGLPIASGVIEGACRYLVEDRMGITGARWGLETAEAVLRLRALRASGDLDRYLRFHERQERDRVHASRYANQALPSLSRAAPSTASGKPHLRLVGAQ